MSILYVTSFAKDMYLMTGRRLIYSFFIEYGLIGGESNQNLLVCYENFDFDSLNPFPERILTYPLHTSQFLINWLHKNKDIIPDYLGGTATQESHPDIFAINWNKKSSRWFRKIAALHYAHHQYGEQYQYIVWCDSDIYFKNTLPKNLIIQQFDKIGVWYHLGIRRRQKNNGFESGFIGFNRLFGGFDLLLKVFNIYSNGEFRKLQRWDDGWVFRYVILDHNPDPSTFTIKDLVPIQFKLSVDVIDVGPFKDFIKHDKGLHAKHKIMI